MGIILPRPSQVPPEFVSRDMFSDDEQTTRRSPRSREPIVGGEEELIAQIEGYTDEALRERLAPLSELFEKAPENTRRIILNEIERTARDITDSQKAIEARLEVAQKWIGKLKKNLEAQK